MPQLVSKMDEIHFKWFIFEPKCAEKTTYAGKTMVMWFISRNSRKPHRQDSSAWIQCKFNVISNCKKNTRNYRQRLHYCPCKQCICRFRWWYRHPTKRNHDQTCSDVNCFARTILWCVMTVYVARCCGKCEPKTKLLLRPPCRIYSEQIFFIWNTFIY